MMKQWLINLIRRLNNWEQGMGKHLDRFELVIVEAAYFDLFDEVQSLDLTQELRREAFDRQQRLERDNFLASQQIERIDKHRKLVNLEHRRVELRALPANKGQCLSNL